MREEMTRRNRVIFTYTVDKDWKWVQAVITRSDSDYGYWPEVNTLTITLSIHESEWKLYEQQLVDKDFNLEDVKALTDLLAKFEL